jgi:23S rRNA pseudouridine1911/1915/1917 synthase
VGDPVYRTGRGNAAGALTGFRRQALHAFRLGLVHPAAGGRMQWESPLPADMAQLLGGLAQ